MTPHPPERAADATAGTADAPSPFSTAAIAPAHDELALTPFDLPAGDEPAPAASDADDPVPAADESETLTADTTVVLVRNPATDQWEDANAPEEEEAQAAADAPTESSIDEEGEEKGGWTVALLCAGIAIIAVCLLLPLAEENHQLAYQREKLKLDLEQIKQQVEVNGQFIDHVADDPTLAERLAQRQMNYVREGTSVMDFPDAARAGGASASNSPFLLVSLPPPNPMPPYHPLGGTLSVVARNPRLRLYTLGSGLLLLAAGVILGGGTKETPEPQADPDA